MTDRFHTLTVVLDREIRNDDAESLISAIKCLRGVVSVAGNVADSDTWAARQYALFQLREKIWGVLNDES